MTRMTRHTTTLSVALLVALVLAIFPASTSGGGAIARADTGPTLTLSASTAKANATITVTAQGFAADETVDISLSSDPTYTFDFINCDSEGTCTASMRLPGSNVTQGQNTLLATGESSGLVAQASITINPFFALGIDGAAGTKMQGGPGADIAAYGSGYQADEVVQIYWGTAAEGILEGSPATDDQGNLSFEFHAPTNVTPGKYVVTAVRASKPYTLSATFPIVSPSATVPKIFQGTQRITFNYVGFQTGETIAVSWNANGGQELGVGHAFHDGQGGIVFVAPATVRGTYTLTITGASSGIVLNYPVTVNPTITLNPDTANVGNTITVNGSGYSANETVNVYLQTPGNGSVAVQTDATGSFTAQVGLPDTFDAQISYFVHAKNEAKTDSAKTPFSFIAPWFYSSADYLYGGETDNLAGSGFMSNETINFYWYYQQGGQFLIGTTTTDSDGNFSLEVTSPDDSISNDTVTVAAIGQTSGFIETTQVTMNGS